MKKLFLHLTALLFIGSAKAQEVTITTCACSATPYKMVWMQKNLDDSTYRNGETITHAQTDDDWFKANKNHEGAWCYYTDPNGRNYGSVYGKLYNWYAVNDTKHGGLAPNGWRIPKDEDWDALNRALGTTAGDKMKETCSRPSLWKRPPSPTTIRATNSSCFTGLPGGIRSWYITRLRPQSFLYIREVGYWWSATETPHDPKLNPRDDQASRRHLNYDKSGLGGGNSNKGTGYYVRCIKDPCF